MTQPSVSPSNRGLALLVAGLLALVVAYHLALAAHGYGRYRDQHLGVALHYAQTHISLKETVIPGFNVSATPVIQEIPVWQAAAGAAFKLFGTWWGWANVVSLALFLPCLWPLFQIARQFYGERAAWWTLAAFLSQALVFLYAGEAGTDGFTLAAMLWFLFACTRLAERPGRWFLPALLLGVLLALSKLPFFMAAGLAAFFLLLKTHGRDGRRLAALAGVGAVAGVVFLLWNHWIEAVQSGAEFQFQDMRISSGANGGFMVFWYFGDWHFRLNPANWVKGAWRMAVALLGSFALAVPLGAALISRRLHPAAKFLLAGAVLTMLIFSHLVLVHYHYYLMFAPALALLAGAAFERMENFCTAQGLRRDRAAAALAAVLALALFQGLMGLRAFSLDKFPARITAAIVANTAPADRLAIINGGWGGDQLIRSGRQGLTLWTANDFADPAKYARLKQLGFTKLVIVSESPFHNAIQVVNPGQTGTPRDLARNYLTPQVAQWPTVLETEDLIIKQIP